MYGFSREGLSLLLMIFYFILYAFECVLIIISAMSSQSVISPNCCILPLSLHHLRLHYITKTCTDPPLNLGDQENEKYRHSLFTICLVARGGGERTWRGGGSIHMAKRGNDTHDEEGAGRIHMTRQKDTHDRGVREHILRGKHTHDGKVCT